MRRLFKATGKIAAREAYFFHNEPPPPGSPKDALEAWLRAAPRPPKDFLAGDGAFHMIKHADGIGSWRANAIIFDVHPDGSIAPMDTSARPYTHWFLDTLREVFDCGDDQELLSHVFDGLRYKASRPRQMRILTNMDSLATHVRPIARDISKLADAGMYKVRPLQWLTGPFVGTEGAVWPIATLPAWTAPVGAVDKKDKANEKRRISNGSAPYNNPRAWEDAHGVGEQPTGPPCESFNVLSGPMRPPRGTPLSTSPFHTTPWGAACDYCGDPVTDSTHGEHAWWGRLYCWRCWEAGEAIRFEPLKWHRERKHSPRTVYQADTALVALAELANEDVFSVTTDFRWWFWQFGTHPTEYWTSQFLAVVRVGDEYAVCLVGELVANMGRSPVSNIASAVGSRLFEPIRRMADEREGWLLEREPQALRDAVEARREKYGDAQARLFWGGCFTDDSITRAVGALRMALIARDISELNEAVNIWLADLSKCPLGTAVVHIGCLFLPNASIGTITAAKRVRALHSCRGMVEGTLNCEDFESAQGLLGHVVEVLALDATLLNGLGRQRRFAFDHHLSTVVLTDDTRGAVAQLETLVAATPSATIFSAINAASTPLACLRAARRRLSSSSPRTPARAATAS